MLRLIFISCLIITALTSVKACDGNANEFIDEVLNNARSDVPNEIPLADMQSGKTRIHSAWIYGLKNFARGGNSCFDAISDRLYRVTLNVQMNDVSARCTAQYRVTKFPKITQSGDVRAKIDYIRVRGTVQLDLNARTLQMIDYHVENVGGFDVKISLRGLAGILNPIVNRFIDKNKLLNSGIDKLRDALIRACSRFNRWDIIPF